MVGLSMLIPSMYLGRLGLFLCISENFFIKFFKAEGFASLVAESAPTAGNIRGSAAYRTHLIRVLVERSMNELGGM